MDDLAPMESAELANIQAEPHSREAEEAVLGAVLINPEAFYDVAQFLKPEDFYIVRNRWIWETFNRLHESRAPIDFLTVCEDMEQHSRLSEVGGAAYIMSLINQTPTSVITRRMQPNKFAGAVSYAILRRFLDDLLSK